MTSELERLVELTLANGEISDKERNVLIAKAHALGIGVDELDVIIQAKIEQSGQSASTAPEQTLGVITKCPACGASVEPLAEKCKCRHVFRFDTLNNLIDEVTRYPQREPEIVRSTKIPIANEPVRELLSYAIGRISDPSCSAVIRNAWLAKLEEVVSIAESNQQIEIDADYLGIVKRKIQVVAWENSIEAKQPKEAKTIADLLDSISKIKLDHAKQHGKDGDTSSSDDEKLQERIALMIEAFPIPTGKVELLSFLSECAAKGTSKESLGTLNTENMAWNKKAQAVVTKARILFPGDESFVHELNRQEAILKTTATRSTIISTTIGVLFIAGMILWFKSC